MSRAILIVDDNAITRKLVRFSLEAAGFEVREAGTGDEALAAAAERPDLILQDLVLPDVDGFVLLEQLRALVGAQVPILAFTGLLSKLSEARLGTSGFDDVISKPIEPTRLREVVRGYFPDESAPAESFGGGRTLVLADDDAVQRKLAAYRLSRLGFEVITAADGEEALALSRTRCPDVIVSDVLMPRMDGFELCSRVRSDPQIAATPVVLLTNSYLEDEDFALARRVGADGYVVRTPELTELSLLLRQTVGRPVRRTTTPQAPSAEVQNDRIGRALRQLDRQVALNATLTQRCAMLSAELAILGGLTSALAEHGDPQTALDAALSACFDAGGISWGVLLVRSAQGGWSRRAIGLSPGSLERAGAALERAAAEPRVGRDPFAPRRAEIPELLDTEASSPDVLLAPIVHRDRVLGALFLGAGDGLDEHRAAFAGVVAGQLALTITLGATFHALERATVAERARVHLLESILDAIDDSVVVVDAESRVSLWNRAAEPRARTLSANPPGEWARELSLFKADQRSPVEWQMLPLVRALRGEIVAREEIVQLSPGEPPLWLSSNARPVFGEGGRIEGAVSVSRDVTAEKLAQAHQILADRMASIGTLAAGVVHELNNPLSAVVSEIAMALEDTVGTPVHEGLENAREAADRVRIILRDLKTLSRGDTDEIGPVDLSRVVAAAVRMASAETRGRALVVEELAEVPAVLANEPRLGQVFLNLIVNAAQAIPTGAPSRHRITVRTRMADDGGIVAEVSDTGTGMPPEVRARLFTPFFTTKPVGAGTGLGLSISQRIVTAAGGTIDVETAPGAGTTFRLWFPASAGQVSKHSERAEPGERRRVLVIDDDPLVLQMITRTLRAEYDIHVEQSAKGALARLARGDAFDAVIYDIEMPELAGSELHSAIAASRPDLLPCLVFLVARSAAAAAAPFLATAAAQVVEKPVDARALRAALDARTSGPRPRSKPAVGRQ